MTLHTFINCLFTLINGQERYLLDDKHVFVFDEDTKNVKTVESLSLNNGHLQINVERWYTDENV